MLIFQKTINCYVHFLVPTDVCLRIGDILITGDPCVQLRCDV